MDAFTYRFEVAKVSEAHAIESDTDSGASLKVLEPDKPFPKRILPRFSQEFAEFALFHGD